MFVMTVTGQCYSHTITRLTDEVLKHVTYDFTAVFDVRADVVECHSAAEETRAAVVRVVIAYG